MVWIVTRNVVFPLNSADPMVTCSTLFTRSAIEKKKIIFLNLKTKSKTNQIHKDIHCPATHDDSHPQFVWQSNQDHWPEPPTTMKTLADHSTPRWSVHVATYYSLENNSVLVLWGLIVLWPTLSRRHPPTTNLFNINFNDIES